jgi:hypothetical protein
MSNLVIHWHGLLMRCTVDGNHILKVEMCDVPCLGLRALACCWLHGTGAKEAGNQVVARKFGTSLHDTAGFSKKSVNIVFPM